ncbi:hypothetical protein ACFL6U_32545 [Planctomycetota bacterium]
MSVPGLLLSQCINTPDQMIIEHWRILGHEGIGSTELRIFDPIPMVAYADGAPNVLRLCQEMAGKTKGIYIGVQPRPLHLFDRAPNRWVPAQGGPTGNCAKDSDIEIVATQYLDIDSTSAERKEGYAASLLDLAYTLRAAQLVTAFESIIDVATVACTGNGHCVLINVVPIPVYGPEETMKAQRFCEQLVQHVAGRVSGVRFDPVFNASRVMRVMGTMNCKAMVKKGRPQRRARFVTEPIYTRSFALHHMILNTEVGHNDLSRDAEPLPETLRCNLKKIENCCFIQYCRTYPRQVTEPQWWGMITNMARLEGGRSLIHEISRLDPIRYNYRDTERVIERAIAAGYRPVSCQKLMSSTTTKSGQGVLTCPRIRQCPARAPMYLTAIDKHNSNKE